MHKVFPSAPEHIQIAHQFLLILPPRGSSDPTLSSFPLTMVQGFRLLPQWGSSVLSGFSAFTHFSVYPLTGPNGFPLAIRIYNIDLNLLFLDLEIIAGGRKYLSKLWTQLSNSEKMLKILQEMAVALLFTLIKGGSSTRHANCLLVCNKMLHVCSV